MIIGLTGGIACGKSTVGAMLVERGALLVDADQTARDVVQLGEPTLAAIVDRFGSDVLSEDSTLDRAALGRKVFADKEELAALEAIMHPAIRERMKEAIAAHKKQYPQRLVVADIPLLYETQQEHTYNEGIMVVYIPRDLQVVRLMQRSGMSQEEAERRVDLQLDIEEKKRRAKWLIDNSGSVEATRAQIDRFWSEEELS